MRTGLRHAIAGDARPDAAIRTVFNQTQLAAGRTRQPTRLMVNENVRLPPGHIDVNAVDVPRGAELKEDGQDAPVNIEQDAGVRSIPLHFRQNQKSNMPHDFSQQDNKPISDNVTAQPMTNPGGRATGVWESWDSDTPKTQRFVSRELSMVPRFIGHDMYLPGNEIAIYRNVGRISYRRRHFANGPSNHGNVVVLV